FRQSSMGEPKRMPPEYRSTVGLWEPSWTGFCSEERGWSISFVSLTGSEATNSDARHHGWRLTRGRGKSARGGGRHSPMCRRVHHQPVARQANLALLESESSPSIRPLADCSLRVLELRSLRVEGC